MGRLSYVLLFFYAYSSFAGPELSLVADFKTMLGQRKLTPSNDQSFCYEQDDVQGYQVDKLQRIASVTKLLTTFMAAKSLDLNKTYITRLYINGDRLHIEGIGDPYFEEEKMLLLMQALNDLNYKNFKLVTFNSRFFFSDAALGAHADITSAHVKSKLAYYFNPGNAKALKNIWARVVKFAQEEGVMIDVKKFPSIKAGSVALSDVNPIGQDSQQVLVHRSRSLKAILKSMNVMSKNMVAQYIYLESAKVKSFDTLMQEVGIHKSSYNIYNGSGLPIKNGTSRLDNLASCRTVLKVIRLLYDRLAELAIDPSEIMAVNGGKDLGSFRERFLKQPETHEAVISKTGTLMHASSIAGVLLIGGTVPFALLNHTTNVVQARKFQDDFIARMFNHLGEATPVNYEKISIFPWDGEEFFELQ